MILLTIPQSKVHGDHYSTDNGAIHLALMIWFVGMNDTRVMECTSLYYKLKDDVTNLDPYWQFVYCARRVLGMGEWEGWEDVENDKPQDEALKKFRSVLSIECDLHLVQNRGRALSIISYKLVVIPKISQSQDFKTTFKQNLTCIFLSVKLNLLMSVH